MSAKLKAKRRGRGRSDEIAAPAKIAADHVQNRAFVIEVPESPGAKRVIAPGKGWRRLSPLEQGEERFAAGERNRPVDDFERRTPRAQASGRMVKRAVIETQAKVFQK